MTKREVTLHRGLTGIYLERTQSSFIDGIEGKLLYRGYNIHDLAAYSTLEEVVYLLVYGKLPTNEELSDLDRFLRDHRDLPEEIYALLRSIKSAAPMDVLRTAVSALGALDPEVNDNDLDAVRRKGLRLTAQAPTIVCAHNRIRNGLEPIKPQSHLNHAGNFLYMLHGQEPEPEATKLLDTDFIVHAEHGSNASAFAARVTASTLADLHAAIVTGIATLKGPLHGGAAESVMRMAMEIGEPERAADYVKGVLSRGGRVMGFGHRVYKAEDPRARHIRELSRGLGEKLGQPKWFQILQALVEAMKPYQARGIFVNVDFFAGSVYHLMGIPEDLFVPIFALGRIPGWTLQVMEQYANNILIRPLLYYEGPKDLEYIPIEQRGNT
jgi:citrate synthase